eukprot:gb/GECG01009546.1/.p1 GENE.gb/GECG01009546.1/~~gb/GECG01009546.1/.p1  ORF type:complete len:151 (+),score=35.63 gb/GECG01009546.1/:1-453(+)
MSSMSSASGAAASSKSDNETKLYKEKVRGGKLKLKGAEVSTKKKKSKPKKRSREESDGEHKSSKKQEPGETPAERAAGTGRIISSGDTIHGQETKFLKDLQVGDAIEIFHPTSLKDETRVVRMILSDVSLAIKSDFKHTFLLPTTSSQEA